MFCEVSRYVKSSLAVVVVRFSRSRRSCLECLGVVFGVPARYCIEFVEEWLLVKVIIESSLLILSFLEIAAIVVVSKK